jgi:hypothetical protein
VATFREIRPRRTAIVRARAGHDPALLKPSPHLITQAVDALNAEPGQCALVGDSVTDIKAAQLASVQSIGYASEPGKREQLTEAGAGAIINSLADLALRLRAHVANPELLQLSLRTFSRARRARRGGWPPTMQKRRAPRALSARGTSTVRSWLGTLRTLTRSGSPGLPLLGPAGPRRRPTRVGPEVTA